jgi:hypothetical protein
MNPLIAIAAQVFPQILKAITDDNNGGTVEKQVVQAVTNATGANTADQAKQKVDADPKVATDLSYRRILVTEGVRRQLELAI